MTNDEILKLAKKCGIGSDCKHFVPEKEIKAFYRAAFNAGIEAAAQVCDNNKQSHYTDNALTCADHIRNLEMK